MKRLISSLLLLITFIVALTSCDVKYDEAEVKAAAKELIEESVLLNDIYWGEGLPHSDDKNTSDGVYYTALESYHYSLGFKTIDELKTLTEKTFSKGFCQTQIYPTILESVQDGDKAIILSRYYQKYGGKNFNVPEYIMVNSTWKKILDSEVEYDYESIVVKGSDEERVYVTLKATVKKDGYDPQTREIEIALVEEDDGWKIDSPTYLNYYHTENNK